MKNIFIILLWLTGMALSCLNLKAQQLPISHFQKVKPGRQNPAYAPRLNHTELFFAHQNRDVKASGFQSSSSFIQLQSSLKGRNRAMSLGFHLNHLKEHTEQRLGLGASASAKVLQTNNSSLSLGVLIGIINWNSNYSNIRNGDSEDPLLQIRSNAFELDAGAGAFYSLQNHFLNLKAEASANQLAGNMLSDQLIGLRVLPHFQIRGSALFNAAYNIGIGPIGWFGDVFNRRDTSYQSGLLDLGLKTNFERQNFWIAGLYRLDRSALNLAFGLKCFENDTLEHTGKAPFQMDLQISCAYPLQQSNVFGPSVEIGLDFILGKKVTTRIDTLMNAKGVFWSNEASLTRYKVHKLDPNGPPNLTAQTDVLGKYVYLNFGFPDNTLMYVGESPSFKDSNLREIGWEWEGVDGLLENIVEEVIMTALHPDTSQFKDPENLETLKGISTLELSCLLRDQGFGLNMSSDVIYGGELGFNNQTQDTLFIETIFDERDTLLAITSQQYLTNLELAALKLHVMRMKLDFELQEEFEDDFDILWEGEPIIIDDMQIPILIKKLRILSDNPHQQAFQVNQLELKFTRLKRFRVEEDDGWIPAEEWEKERKKRKIKRLKK